MKKFLIKSFFFALFFAVFFILINIIYIGIISATDFNFIKRFETLNFDNPDFDLLVLGASLPQDGIDTELLTSRGIKSYNTTIDGSTIRTDYIQLNEYLTKYAKRPKVVLLGVNSYMDPFSDEGIQPIVEVTMKDYKFGLKDAPILKFKWLGFEFLKKVVSKKHRNAKLSYGQLKFQKTNTDNTTYSDKYLNITKFETSQWIGEIARLCNQNGIKLIILEMPGYLETQNLSGTGPYKLSFTNGCSAELYNYNSKIFCKIFDPHKDWIGNSHLNEFGAIKFTEELIKILKKHF